MNKLDAIKALIEFPELTQEMRLTPVQLMIYKFIIKNQPCGSKLIKKEFGYSDQRASEHLALLRRRSYIKEVNIENRVTCEKSYGQNL